ncbi:SVEP1-like protein, partial [Mya arenaria]
MGSPDATCNATGQWDSPLPNCTIYDCGEPYLTDGVVNTSNGTQYEATAYFSCNDGYFLTGSPDATCNATGQWDSPLPNCTIHDCGELNLTNGNVITSTGTQFEATAYFSCNDGYFLTGSPDATCNATGQWDSPLPNCTIHDCGELNLTNGNVITSTGTQFEAIASFSCSNGYFLTGSPDATCNATGQWDSPLPNCTIHDCGELNLTDGNVITSTGTQFEATAYFSCSNGYFLTGSPDATCNATGQWDSPLPNCTIHDCGELNLTNGNVITSTGTQFAAIASFSCSNGYFLTGSPDATCNATGQWDSPLPNCTIHDCGELNLTDGNVITSTGTQFEATAYFSCSNGYFLTGSPDATCNATGQWDSPLPNCTIHDCGELNLTNGNVITSTGTQFEAIASFSCSNGYFLTGSPDATCNATGQWDSPLPNCTIHDCGELNLTNGNVITSTGTQFEATAYFSCSNGYILTGSPDATCNATGQWDSPLPNCTIHDCGELNLTNGNVITSTGTQFEAIASFSCSNGYFLTGSPDATCNATGQWDSPLPNCTIHDCGELNLTNGNVITSTGTQFEATASFSCSNGYFLTGSPDATCNATGQWDSLLPNCTIHDCGELNLTNGNVITSTGTQFEATASFSCNDGYFLTGSPDATCNATGQWDSPLPNCTIHDCGELNLTNGNVITSTGTQFEAIASFSCSNGYFLTGSPDATCNATGQWDSPLPNCTIHDCGELNLTNGNVITSTGTQFEATAYFSCNDGYFLTGSPDATCNATGQWDSPLPNCTIHDCGELNLTNGNVITSTGTQFEAIASFSCSNGYFLTGSPDATCNVTGQWDSPLPNCTIHDCGELNLTNGNVITSTGTQFEAIASFSCSNGYFLTGSPDATCNATGQWDSPLPNCTIHDCGELNLTNGNVITSTGTQFEAIASFSCSNGYFLTGSPDSTCNATGQWDSPLPNCTIHDCGELNLTNGNVITSTGTQFEATAYFSCSNGYFLTGSPDATCNATGQWDSPLPNCTIHDCGELNLTNGNVITSTGTQFEATASFSCSNGYFLTGSPDATCNATGQWDSPLPNCTIHDCGELNLTNGNVITSTGTQFEATAYFSCNDGYFLTGSPDATCNTTGQWDSPLPNCTIHDCGELNLTNGNVITSTGTQFEATAYFSCNDGYFLTGSPDATCNATGQWDSPLPNCTIHDCGELNLTNGNVITSTGTQFEAIASFSCSNGYFLTGSPDATCNATGQWDSPLPNCTIHDCGELNLTNGNVITSTGTQFEATAYFSCNDGYFLTGSPDATCNATGQWDSPLPNCTIHDCGELNLTNGNVITSTGTQFEAIASFSCSNGYFLTGSPDATCNATGQWDSPLPNCTIHDCGELNLTNGNVITSTGTQFEATAYFSCSNGYFLTGSPDATCNATGQWDSPLPNCTIHDCGELNLTNGNVITSTGTQFEATAYFSCNDGYFLTGSPDATCNATGQWDNPLHTTCSLVDCFTPDEISNGNVFTSSMTTFGQNATYTCSEGYNLTGAHIRTCQGNGSWSFDTPSCLLVECGDLLPPTNGNIAVSTGTTFGQQAVYSCQHGYDLNGANTRTCTANGTWSGSPPGCIARTTPSPKKLYIMPCICYEHHEWENLTQEEIIDQLVKDLSIDVTNTTLAQSRLISRSDPRASSAAIGTVAISLLAVIFGTVACLDVLTIWKDKRFSRCRKTISRRCRGRKIYDVSSVPHDTHIELNDQDD